MLTWWGWGRGLGEHCITWRAASSRCSCGREMMGARMGRRRDGGQRHERVEVARVAGSRDGGRREGKEAGRGSPHNLHYLPTVVSLYTVRI
ncbi:hypothetical protein E2C01_024391 [Portunus trituberculatus]|uniref:Uncharacterized protein n=1 Tax=Portunus trituberculatus TaxID=210409 RepID=A0A5B7EAF9_PORTR|nr:hypothetical protein [Portunus trituberculatus]